MQQRQVPFIDLQREFNKIGDEISSRIKKVIENGRFILHDEAAAFEDEFSTYVGAEHGIGVNSGSDALYLALQGINIEQKEVILPSHTFISTADAVVRNGGIPVFVDIDPKTYTIDPNEIKNHVNKDTAAIIPVHLYGHPADMDPILEIAQEYDAAVIEDASQAHGATYKGKPVGSFGDMACFSFYPTKNLGAYGDGGIVVTSNDLFANEIRKMREYGSSEKYRYESIGINSRLDEVQAAVLRYKLSRLDEFNTQRQKLAHTYDDLLKGVENPTSTQDADHVFHLYVIESDKRDELQNYLENHGIQTLIHYPTPIHEQPSYKNIGMRGDLEITEEVTDRILSLPMYPWCRAEEVEYVSEIISGF